MKLDFRVCSPLHHLMLRLKNEALRVLEHALVFCVEVDGQLCSFQLLLDVREESIVHVWFSHLSVGILGLPFEVVDSFVCRDGLLLVPVLGIGQCTCHLILIWHMDLMTVVILGHSVV